MRFVSFLALIVVAMLALVALSGCDSDYSAATTALQPWCLPAQLATTAATGGVIVLDAAVALGCASL